ncbi:His/Glu/Gln/Arg/opine family amino acid ABC transporter permease subunit [Flexivirga oryzae]|uniref:His/Glu/Gln/Arg/opine family amino acid ABC transporter permease subunit n=1 Tax=Flexivirga oryzae TaxID=1794944 RepID=A0A839NES6_9MICO|nr:His/Glu/Gln/Arg/opine family amino acid ABC transporter permease subunit [Flexivirga oryzae]
MTQTVGKRDPWRPSEVERERAAYRTRQRRRSFVIGAISTIVVVAVVLVVLVTSPGWQRFHSTFFDPHEAVQSFPVVLRGLWLNVRVMVVCGLAIAVWSLLLAVLRTLRGPVFFPLRAFAVVYVDVFRGLPLLLVVFLLGFGVPALQLTGLPNSPLFWGGCALTLSYSAYVAEVLRAGIESVHPSQRAAARSLGLSYRATLRFVVLPQAVRRVMPALMNDLISLEKDSALLAVIGVVDALREAQIREAVNFNFTAYVVAWPAVHLPDDPDGPFHRLVRATARLPGSGWTAVSLLSLKGVRKSFGAHLVLADVSLEVQEGACVVLIGASGSGKSTLLRCINLLEVVDDGVVELDGQDITDPRVDGDEVRSRMGMVFQSYNLFPHLSVLQNITLAPVRVHGVPRAQALERAHDVLQRVGLADKANARPDDLSGGQQQRVAIARAMVNAPRLLLLDEVTSALDPELVGEVLDLLQGLREEGMTMVLNTHEMGFARSVADEVCFLSDGVILERGPAEEVLGAPQQERTQRFLSRLLH